MTRNGPQISFSARLIAVSFLICGRASAEENGGFGLNMWATIVDRDGVVRSVAFSGDDRYIVDYLAEEVLRGQPEDVRRFLLRTSFLGRALRTPVFWLLGFAFSMIALSPFNMVSICDDISSL